MATPPLPARLKPTLDRVTAKFSEAEDGGHRVMRDRWDTFDSLWHSYNEMRSAANTGRPRDQDRVLGEARTVFGDALFIPHTFATVENQLPRIVSNRPRGLVLPGNRASEANVEPVSAVIKAQQRRMKSELALQDIARSGLLYGLGVGKGGWRCQYGKRPKLVPKRDPKTLAREGWSVSDPESAEVWDDPWFEQIDIYDFLWNRYGSNMTNVGWVIHRAWRSTEYVLGKLGFNPDGTPSEMRQAWLANPESDARPAWDLMPELEKDAVDGATAVEQYSNVWGGRLRNQGYPGARPKGSIHELWEFHDGKEVIVVLDRQWPVYKGKNPSWHGELPFHIYRPTKVLNAMVGKGAVEPMMELQFEMNALRTDRRWNALLKLHQAWAFRDGSVDPGDIKIAPGALVPVSGDPANLLQPLTVGDIPNSGYQEEGALKSDIDAVTGMSDMQLGTDVGGNQTATGVQLSLAQANLRLQLQTHLLETETVEPWTEQQILLNQQHIRDNRDYRTPAMPTPDEPDRMWTWIEANPENMAGLFSYEVDGGSLSPENEPQRQAKAQTLIQIAQNPLLNNRAVTMEAMRLLGFPNAQLYMAPEEQPIPSSFPDRMKQALQAAGGDPSLVDAVAAAAQREQAPA